MAVLVLLSTFAPISITLMLVTLGELSRRLGAVVKRGPLHRWFYVAATLSFLSMLVRLLSMGFSTEEFRRTGGNSFIALAYTLPLMAGLLVGLVVAWRYWGWLVYASDGQTPVPTRRQRL